MTLARALAAARKLLEKLGDKCPATACGYRGNDSHRNQERIIERAITAALEAERERAFKERACKHVWGEPCCFNAAGIRRAP